MDKVTADERAMMAERAVRAAEAWGLARARGDERLRVAALRDYRDARREARAIARQSCRLSFPRMEAIRRERTAAALERIANACEAAYAKLTPAQRRKALASSPESVAAMRAKAEQCRAVPSEEYRSDWA